MARHSCTAKELASSPIFGGLLHPWTRCTAGCEHSDGVSPSTPCFVIAVCRFDSKRALLLQAASANQGVRSFEGGDLHRGYVNVSRERRDSPCRAISRPVPACCDLGDILIRRSAHDLGKLGEIL